MDIDEYTNAFVFTAEDLLKNIPFDRTKCSPFKLKHYMALKHLSNGFLDNNIFDSSAYGELKKLNFKIDHLKRYIINNFEYEFVILEYDFSIIHVLNADTKSKIGHLNVSIDENNDKLSIIATLTD